MTSKTRQWHQKHAMTSKGLSSYMIMSMTSNIRFHNILFPKWWQKCQDDTKAGHNVTNTFCYEVKNRSWCQWHQKYVFKIFCSRVMNKNVRTPKAGHEIRHDNNKFALKQRTHHDVCHVIKNFYNVRHDVNSIAYVMTSKHLLWCHKHVMILKSHDVKQFALTSACSSWCQNTSWGQKVRHYFKKFAMTSTRRHHAKKFVMTSQDLSWRQKYSKCLSWNQKYVMMSKSLSWCQKVRYGKRFVITSKNKTVITSKIRHDVKKFYHTKKTRRHKVRHNIKNTSWRLRFVMKSKGVSWHEKHVMTSKSLL